MKTYGHNSGLRVQKWGMKMKKSIVKTLVLSLILLFAISVAMQATSVDARTYNWRSRNTTPTTTPTPTTSPTSTQTQTTTAVTTAAFGYTQVGPYTDRTPVGDKDSCRYQAPQTGTITSISMYI
jgi:hypothetical protein